jgi:SNF2 family DNA or RNA helicase
LEGFIFPVMGGDPVMTTKSSAELTLKDRLSRLSFVEACKLLGPDGPKCIREGGARHDTIDIDQQVLLGDDLFRLTLPHATVTIALRPDRRDRLAWSCTACDVLCEHVGAAFSLILEEKTPLGLAEVPPDREPVDGVTDEELVRRAIEERRERSRIEKMRIESREPGKLWTDYTVTSKASGMTYRVALRGWDPGESFCSCPDFRKNTLGTCKHILHALEKLASRFPPSVRNTPYRRKHIALHIRYGRVLELRLLLPEKIGDEVARIVRPIRDVPIDDIHDLLRRIRKLEELGREVVVYPDAEEYIQGRLFRKHIEGLVAEIRRDPARHPLRKGLLRTELLPYQLDGIAFAMGAGRAVLADDMGLGKTIQGIGAAELLAREAGIRKVLVICPATLKSQWRDEILRFSGRDCQLILGPSRARAAQYGNGCFFTVCNYEQVLRDIIHIERIPWDLTILDEGQRIKNWEAKTSRVIKGLRSRFALVLSGTPMENRIDELFSVVEFIDDRRLGPAFRFFDRHRVVDEKGHVTGYRNLDSLREDLKPVLLRRTRESVLMQLPPRTTEFLRIPPTGEQADFDLEQSRVIAHIVSKRYLTEMDLLRLQKALLLARMNADSTFLVHKKEPGFSSKLDELDGLIERLAAEEGRKIVLFSEWTTMLDLIQRRILEKRNLQHVRLDGSIPQKLRQRLVREFQDDPKCTLFIATNAGSTGLNLQAANTVINVDLPWNPAILEQRIGRAHRMGQKRPVHVFILVTEATIEEKLLKTLGAKRDLALAALDPESEVSEVDFRSNMEELKARLEILLGAKPEAPVDVSEEARRKEEAERIARKERVGLAGGQLLTAAFSFLGEMLPGKAGNGGNGGNGDAGRAAEAFRSRFAECLEKDEKGRPRLTVTLPDEAALDSLAKSLAALLDWRGAAADVPD